MTVQHSSTKTLHAYGDSFVVGDQDDWWHLKDPNVRPRHNMRFEERLEYLKNHVSFVSLLAKHYGLNLQNHAIRGCGNYPQLDRLCTHLIEGVVKPGDIVLFGFSTFFRDRVQLHLYEAATTTKTGPHLIDRDLLAKDADTSRIIELDFFYVVSLLDKLSAKFGVPIIKFNLFDNALHYASKLVIDMCQPSNFLGYGQPGNTLIDILNDTWGVDSACFWTKNAANFNHDKLPVKPEHEYLYTYYRHPSIEGHKKIANWWIENNILELNNEK